MTALSCTLPDSLALIFLRTKLPNRIQYEYLEVTQGNTGCEVGKETMKERQPSYRLEFSHAGKTMGVHTEHMAQGQGTRELGSLSTNSHL